MGHRNDLQMSFNDSRSSGMTRFDRAPIISYWRFIINNCGRIVSEIQRDGWKSRGSHDTGHGPFGDNLSSVVRHLPKTICLRNFKCVASVPKILRGIRKIESGLRNDLQMSLKVIGNDTV